jgi:membrane protein DedA with SNARE-associated domain
MELEPAFTFVIQYGYTALFFILWIGFFFIPVPNEMIVMTSGFVTSRSFLQEIPALIVTYAGTSMSLTTLYLLGRFFFVPIQTRLMLRPKIAQYIHHASFLIEKYGPLALIVGYFFPGVRHFVPFLIGGNRTKFRTFSLYAYSTAAVWTILFFLLGFNFGSNMDQVLKMTYLGLIPIVCIVLVVVVYKYTKRKKLGS